MIEQLEMIWWISFTMGAAWLIAMLPIYAMVYKKRNESELANWIWKYLNTYNMLWLFVALMGFMYYLLDKVYGNISFYYYF